MAQTAHVRIRKQKQRKLLSFYCLMLSVRTAAVLWLCLALHITMTTAVLYQFLAKFTIAMSDSTAEELL